MSRDTMFVLVIVALLLVALAATLARRITGLQSQATTRHKVVFVSYGCDKFTKSKIRLRSQVEQSRLFDAVWMYEPDDVKRIIQQKAGPDSDVMEVMNIDRGGGCWIWKPIVLQHALSRLDEGDILVYSDAGCWFEGEMKSFVTQDLEAVAADPIGISHCGTKGGEREKYIRMDVLSALVDDISGYLTANEGFEFEANRLIICKKKLSSQFVDEWAGVAFNNPRYFTDDRSSVPNHRNFMDHRHDQSIYNALAFKYGIDGKSCDLNKWLVAKRIRE